jgi:GntR family transcriptional regulator
MARNAAGYAGVKKGGEALYLQLAERLRRRIESAQYKPGDCLPTERDIAGEFGVSLITVRAACRILVDEGLILRQAGKGTFVTQKPDRITYEASTSLADNYAYGGDVERLTSGQSQQTQRECLCRKPVSVDGRTAELLRIPLRTKVLECRVRVCVNSSPVGLIISMVLLSLGQKITRSMLEERSLILLLSEKCKVRVVEAEQWISASRANRQTAEALNMRTGDPVLVIRRLFYGPKKTPTHISTVIYRGDRFRQHIHLR